MKAPKPDVLFLIPNFILSSTVHLFSAAKYQQFIIIQLKFVQSKKFVFLNFMTKLLFAALSNAKKKRVLVVVFKYKDAWTNKQTDSRSYV